MRPSHFEPMSDQIFDPLQPRQSRVFLGILTLALCHAINLPLSSQDSEVFEMAQRYQMNWIGLIPYVGYHHVIMIILAISIVFMSILLAGCTSNGLTNVYLLSLSYQDIFTPKTSSLQVNPAFSKAFTAVVNTTTSLELRTAFIGLCLRENHGIWQCSSSAHNLADTLNGSAGDPLNMIWLANTFKAQMMFSALIFVTIPLVAIAIILLATFPGWHDETSSDGSERQVKPFPSRTMSYAILAMLALASMLIFVSIFWAHIGSSAGVVMAETLTYGAVRGHVGSVAMGLGWSTVFLVVIAAIGIFIMILSINTLSGIAD
ncbi:Ca2+ regulator and membrane fusion protein Fig1-domain-containing protein [Calycina marina]|uniref:Ca2+ regulator and membrane fusion protein Fig1-domain-containing protein n=1 Tax=Calycina marina TaxID=1763456 RepID=A0A9P7ZBQ4_9HELO|nr:Ca2+ regulator and membrane fusion protein Fig1-domain-containing protein [Calycina marina]